MNAKQLVGIAGILALTSAGCGGSSSNPQNGLIVMQASGGVVGSGGATTGGALITGGALATGGALTTGGTNGTGGTGGTMSTASCTITPTAVVSTVIPTVATVTFTTDFAGMDAAEIEFGLDTTYGMTAPVDLMEANYKTYLVGMKAAKTYHYRVVVKAGSDTCEGPDNTVQTGPLPNGLPVFTVTTPQPTKVNGGFIVGGFFVMTAGPGGTASGKPAFIIDSDGDYVWAFDAGDASRVRMSPDAKYVWIRNTNVGGGMSLVTRVSMDGTDVKTYGNGQEGFGDGHHDFAIMPNGNLLLIDHAGCDTIVERSTDGTSRTIMDAADAQMGVGMAACHVNAIHYHPDDDTITFSDLSANHYVKIRRDTGAILWILGGTNNQFTGDGTSWDKQHGHHWPSSDHMLMFNNTGPNMNSWIYDLQIDETAKTANRVLSYDSGTNSPVLGDVQGLPNGNILVTVSTAGLMTEIDSTGAKVREYSTGVGSAFGFIQARDSLYGPPDRW